MNLQAIRPSRAARAVAAGLLAGLLAGAASATPSELSTRVRELVEGQSFPLDAEVDVTVGEPDARLSLAPCAAHEPFIPAGTRLWGRASLGVRCVQGASWTAYVPVTVRVHGPALVAARPVARGQALGPDDLRVERVEWTRWPAGVLAIAPDQAEGRIAARGFQPGEVLRRDMLREAPAFRAGEPVRVVYAGTGFSVAAEGKALTAGFDGQRAQAAVSGGRVVTGVVRPGGILEVR